MDGFDTSDKGGGYVRIRTEAGPTHVDRIVARLLTRRRPRNLRFDLVEFNRHPVVTMLSPASVGVLAGLMPLLHAGAPYGTLTTCTGDALTREHLIRGIAGADVEIVIDRALGELEGAGALVRLENGILCSPVFIELCGRHVVDGAYHRVHGAEGMPAWRREVFEADNWVCRDCGSDFDLTIDHIVARVRGGTNARGNLQTLCRACNSRKGARA